MRPLSLPPTPVSSDPDARWRWLVACLQEIERASQEEPAQIFDSYDSNGTPNNPRSLNVVSPTAQNTAQVLASLISDFRGRGVNRGIT